MIISESEFEQIYQKDGATGLKVLNSNGLEFVRLVLEPTAIIEKHSLPVDVYFYVLKGTGKLKIDENEYIINSDTLVFCRANQERIWQNIGNTELSILVIKKIS